MTVRSENGAGPRQRLNVETARQLLDFRGTGVSSISAHAAEEQLNGAVAIHNILQEHDVAYLADEVGMGKTFVALGALALLRHFEPSMRVLIIAPRENIQRKWLKEIHNFSSRNVRFPDLRVKAVHGAPARATVMCKSLSDLVHDTAVDADRDFLTRLTSFTLPLGQTSTEGWNRKRDELRRHLPWLDPAVFDMRSKEQFKDNFAKALNCAMPVFDLVIVDEGHNLKGGYKAQAASRNRMLALAFGHPSVGADVRATFRGYGRRAKRVLFLSATPLEDDYAQLWNQLDVFGFGAKFDMLARHDASDEAKRDVARQFLVRRVTSLSVAGKQLTRNLYRQEWHAGGVLTHDEPLATPGDLQRLTVALVQKKVSEVLDQPKFNNRFQIGMLASFESFMETAGVADKSSTDEVIATFDDADQSDREEERRGVDVKLINQLAASYRQKFGRDLAHPKMDTVAERLAEAFTTGEKALVFVRRVASVKELQRKLETAYDEYLFARLLSEVKPVLRVQLDEIIRRYREEKRSERERALATKRSLHEDDTGEDPSSAADVALDHGGHETFFAWFFRGDGPGGGMLSGAVLQNRFTKASATHSTFFDENYVAALLGVAPGAVTDALCARLRVSRGALAERLQQDVLALLPSGRKQQRRTTHNAFQHAALKLLAEGHVGSLSDEARIILSERFSSVPLASRSHRETVALAEWLEVSTFWSALRANPTLEKELMPVSSSADSRVAFREREIRRELLSAVARLGHPFIDLYVMSVNRLERLQLGAREDEGLTTGDLANDFIELLARQHQQEALAGSPEFTSFRELRDTAQNFDLILAVNKPLREDTPLGELATAFGQMLRAQQPVGGMSGKVNGTLVGQFRMPGYPLVLISTDLLQEGEDLHTFCASVHHYGISWMPSSMEQRVGRVDRIASLTERRLTVPRTELAQRDFLQVYYPHLRETVEVLQVERVLERLNRFMTIMHESLGAETETERSLDVAAALLSPRPSVKALTEPLRTAFPIQDAMLMAPARSLCVTEAATQELWRRFLRLPPLTTDEHWRVTWENDTGAKGSLTGSLHLRARTQPFTLLLRSIEGMPVIRCVSPIGYLRHDFPDDEILRATRGAGVRVAGVFKQDLESYDLTIEGDVMLGSPSSDGRRVSGLLRRVAAVADRMEEVMLREDKPMSVVRDDLEKEATYER